MDQKETSLPSRRHQQSLFQPSSGNYPDDRAHAKHFKTTYNYAEPSHNPRITTCLPHHTTY
jgi:hypothetical protein